MNSVGLPTLQGYGLTETSPVVSCNPIHKIKVETVGPPFKGNQVKIANDGEILVKGENVMLGYWNNKKETENVLKNGWLHTGDIGHMENGYLKITDRKKDIIITPGGENISPVKGVWIDATFGAGGYTRALLEAGAESTHQALCAWIQTSRHGHRPNEFQMQNHKKAHPLTDSRPFQSVQKIRTL